MGFRPFLLTSLPTWRTLFPDSSADECCGDTHSYDDMGADSQTPDLGIDPGVLLRADLPGTSTKPRWGERAALIRKLSSRYPELSQGDIARRVGCSPQNVSEVLAEFLEDSSLERLGDFRSDKAEICELIQHRMLASITQDKLDKTPAVSLITAFAIMEDKIRLMRGQPTSMHVHALVDVLDALRMRDGDE